LSAISIVRELQSVLRVNKSCASAYRGHIDEANSFRLHRFSGKVSYLAYPEFETDPHPAPATCVKLNMRSR